MGVPVVGLIVGTESEKVADLLVEAFFGGPDLPNAGQEFIEVVPPAGVLEALVVHDEALDEVFSQMTGGPLTELGAA